MVSFLAMQFPPSVLLLVFSGLCLSAFITDHSKHCQEWKTSSESRSPCLLPGHRCSSYFCRAGEFGWFSATLTSDWAGFKKKMPLWCFWCYQHPRSWENNKRGVRTRVWRGCSQNMEGERDESGFLSFSVEWVGIRNSKISFPSAQCSEYLGYPGFNSWFFMTLRMLLCLLWKWRYHLWVFLMRRSSACKRDNVCLIHVWKVWAPQKHSFHHILVSYLENGNRRRKYF